MNGPKAPPLQHPQQDWLQNCGFQSRPDAVARAGAPGILNHKVENIVAEPPSNVVPLETPKAVPGLNIFPITQLGENSQPGEKTATTSTVPENVASELRTFRQLSSNVYCPEHSRDSLPEYILFGLIALLAAGWPVIAMLRAMASHWR